MPRLDFYANYKLFVVIKLHMPTILIGRSLECDIQLPSGKVSRTHAAILTSDEGHFLEDRSSNGTRVNDQMVTGKTHLKPGDRIYIQDYILIYQADQSQPEDLNKEQTLTDDRIHELIDRIKK